MPLPKRCVRCDAVKTTVDFYNADRTCKECRKALVRDARARNIEQYRSYDRARANRPDRLAARLEYQKTEAFRESHRRALRRQDAKHPNRRKARIAFGNAVRDKKVWVSPCCTAPDCYSTKGLHGHHTHYDDPLTVTWLCSDCHHRVHTEQKARDRQQQSTITETL